MSEKGIETLKELTFISARRLPHGGILYELNSKSSAEWFNTPANRSNFLEYFASNITIKDRSFHILMENVPISFVPENPAAIAEIENKAGFKPRSISKARYIKPAARRNPNQCTAQVIITLASKANANQAIFDGLVIAGKKVYGRKLLPVPTCCLKCHSFEGGHMAAECTQEHDTCGTCGEQHRTTSCSVNDPSDYYCANCKTKGHAAWSRECSIFKQKWDNNKKRNDDAKYIYFPTDDPLTWETVTDTSSTQTPPAIPQWTEPSNQQEP
ncbi:hypothetical protein CY34DRAFT_17663 [Suillus luteus UH-Slu-Lm8-n1]|uniref:Unplaced genomic scaffold CY34scaffold_611, whole genome shotgun sequence n=1 Tax=Suillus luteus UH-Slu-Lm8-n1 TaxID=930992 RepID=A0A0C9ZAK2_9AGAM|nr:hypothetical protein CY34DRAFT_17663 [Suillus luteus UH-Slu-Lm8-n1]